MLKNSDIILMMHKINRTTIIPTLITALFPLFTFHSCKNPGVDRLIILTRVPGKPEVMYVENSDRHYLPQAQLAALDLNDPARPPVILTEEFYSACSPSVSFDGRTILFTAQQKQDDPWNIWEMDLGNLKVRKVIHSSENCTDPVYLPGNRLLFSKLLPGDTLKAGHSLFTCRIDGSDERRITFNPGTCLSSSVLKDGRILTIYGEIFPEKSKEYFMVMRPDGTKAELFYNSIEDRNIISSGRETVDGKIIFIESGKAGTSLVSVNYNRPLHSAKDLSSEIKGEFRSVCPTNSGIMLVSVKKPESGKFGIYAFDPVKGEISKTIYESPGYDIVDVIMTEQHTIPKKLPSEVDMQVKTGLLLCLDINMLDNGLKTSGKASRIEVLGLKESFGIVNVEPDGSFYIKAMADTPFRLQSLDDNGNIIQGPCAWITLRPNERRGCVGCHEDLELVPENRLPLAVKKLPVKLPVHVEKIKEKTVELE